MKKPLKEYVVEKFVNGKWTYHSDHRNELSAVANFEAVSKRMSVRVKQNDEVILERKGEENG
jgi:hypothetical protein